MKCNIPIGTTALLDLELKFNTGSPQIVLTLGNWELHFSVTQYVESDLLKSYGIHEKDLHSMKGYTLEDPNQQYSISPFQMLTHKISKNCFFSTRIHHYHNNHIDSVFVTNSTTF